MLDNAAFGVLRRRARLPSEDLTFGLADDGDDEAGSTSSDTCSSSSDGHNVTVASAPAANQTVGLDPIITPPTPTTTPKPLPIPLKPNPAEQTARHRRKPNSNPCPWSFLHTAAAGSESLSAAVDAARRRVREGRAPVPDVVGVRRWQRQREWRRDRGGRRRPPRPPRVQLGRGGGKRLEVVEEEEVGLMLEGEAGIRGRG